MGRIRRIRQIRPIGLIVGLVVIAAAAAIAATTYTVPPSTRTDWSTSRYTPPSEGLLVVDVVTPDVNDVDYLVDPNLGGYLQRIVYHHDGNAPAWTLCVRDAAGLALYTDADANAVTDPCGVICNYAGGGIPFLGGLTVQVADANQNRAHHAGDGNNVSVRLYIREAWRR